MNLEEFIYNSTKPNTNELKSTDWYVMGIKRKLTTKTKIREALRLKLDIRKICQVTGDIQKPDYENFKWITL